MGGRYYTNDCNNAMCRSCAYCIPGSIGCLYGAVLHRKYIQEIGETTWDCSYWRPDLSQAPGYTYKAGIVVKEGDQHKEKGVSGI